jgi:hypothetical protein
MSALERYQPPRSLGEIERLAGHFAKSGLFGGNPSQIIVKMLAGAENGIPPFARCRGSTSSRAGPSSARTCLRAR